MDAIYEACLRRFRPVMITTMAALLSGSGIGHSREVTNYRRASLGATRLQEQCIAPVSQEIWMRGGGAVWLARQAG